MLVKKITIHVVYDGSAESVERIMTAIERTRGVMNSLDGLYLDEELYLKGTKIIVTKEISYQTET